jgi:hypothetical protein
MCGMRMLEAIQDSIENPRGLFTQTLNAPSPWGLLLLWEETQQLSPEWMLWVELPTFSSKGSRKQRNHPWQMHGGVGQNYSVH